MAKKKETPKQEVLVLDNKLAQKIEDAGGDLNKVEEQNIKKLEENFGEGFLEAIIKSVQTIDRKKAQKLSFDVVSDREKGNTSDLYKHKDGLIPNELIKKICGPQGDELVNQILQARANVMGAFGRPRASRFSVGFEFQPISPKKLPKDKQELEALELKKEKYKQIIWNCGTEKDVGDSYSAPNFSQFLKYEGRDAVGFGAMAIEHIYKPDTQTGEDKWVAFRPVDAGTIYYLYPNKENDQQVRREALEKLKDIKKTKFNVKDYEQENYKYIQVINGQKHQVFTEKELTYYPVYGTNNVEHNGYPLTPIDQAINAIITHISITIHNKLYFQNGRASKGVIVIQTDDVDQGNLKEFKQQWVQSVNSVENSHRVPLLTLGQQDKFMWQTIEASARDMEFQYLSDNNARVILSAFQMSPEELPGYAHLARGTNTQALSESSTEYKLTAARDVGLRPLIMDMQDMLNAHVMPKIDPEFAKMFHLVLTGLDQDDPEKEATRLTQDMSIHMTMNEVLEKVEKTKLPKDVGGDLILNQQFHTLAISPYLTVGQILKSFFGVEGADTDPRYDYIRDPFYFQNQQILLQKAQIAMQQQQVMQQQQMAMQQQMQGQPQGQEDQQEEQPDIQKIETNLPDLSYDELNKNIDKNSRRITKYLLKRHKELNKHHNKEWDKDTKAALSNIVKEMNKKK